jgi:spore germination protein
VPVVPVPGAVWAYQLSGTLSATQLADPAALIPTGTLDTVALCSAVLHADGSLVITGIDRRAGAAFRRQGYRVVPVVVFSDAAGGSRILREATRRSRAVRELASLAGDASFAGLHLDFEYLPPEDAPRLALLLAALRPLLRGKPLSLAIFPTVDFPERWSGFHDMRQLGPFLDEVVLMAYDRFRPGTGPGPVTALAWAESNLRVLTGLFPPARTWLGIPLYGYAWRSADDRRPRVVTRVDRTRREETRDPSGTLRYRSAAGETVYFADRQTALEMAALARRFGLRGVAFWRLGFY